MREKIFNTQIKFERINYKEALNYNAIDCEPFEARQLELKRLCQKEGLRRAQNLV